MGRDEPSLPINRQHDRLEPHYQADSTAITRLLLAFIDALTFPPELVEHVFKVLVSLALRHIENVPHVNSGVLSVTTALDERQLGTDRRRQTGPHECGHDKLDVTRKLAVTRLIEAIADGDRVMSCLCVIKYSVHNANQRSFTRRDIWL